MLNQNKGYGIEFNWIFLLMHFLLYFYLHDNFAHSLIASASFKEYDVKSWPHLSSPDQPAAEPLKARREKSSPATFSQRQVENK